MMEALRSNTLRASGSSMHSLSCINAHHMDELSKEKEEELLYGAGDDGDEEDALSDDSMRLRLSDDDEIEGGDEIKSVSNSPESKSKISESEPAPAKNEDSEMSSPIAEKKLAKSAESDTGRVNQEEQNAGNDFMDENVLEPKRMGNALRPWPGYDSHWRYVKLGTSRGFRNNSNPYPRYRQPRGRFRPQSCDYNVRFNNAFLPFERGRGNAMYNSYIRPMYGSRQQNRGFRQNTMQSPNSMMQLEQNRASPSHTNVSPRTKANNESSVTSRHNSTLANESSAHGDANHRFNESPNKSVDKLQSFHENSPADPDITIIETSLNSKRNLEENAEVIECDRNSDVLECDRNVQVIEDDHRKDPTNANVRILDANRSETRGNVDFSIDSRDDTDDRPRVDEASKNATNNVHLVSEDLCKSDNSEKLEAAGATSEQGAPDKNETVERTQPSSIGTKESNDEAAKPPDTDPNDTAKDKDGPKLGISESDTDREPARANQKPEVPQADCQSISGSSSLVGGKTGSDELQVAENVSNGKTEETLANENKEVRPESSKSSEDRESRASNATPVASSNDFADSKRNDKVKVTETPDNDKKCDSNTQLESANSTNSTKLSTPVAAEDRIAHPRSDPQPQDKDVAEESVETTEKEKSVRGAASKSAPKPGAPSEQNESLPNQTKSSNVMLNDLLASASDAKGNSGEDAKAAVAAVPASTQRKRRRAKKMMVIATQELVSEEDKQVREGGRQKRRTAKNAEEIIRRKFLNHDSDLESSDGSDKFVAVNYKVAQDARALSPPSLKRSPDVNSSTLNDGMKKVKLNSETASDESAAKDANSENIKKLNYVRRFFQRDLNDKLPKLKQQELEELLIQKIVETITMRDEIGRLREQARISERNQEAMRAKCQQLAKQIKDFDMVLTRNAADRRANNDKPVPPIKINRSVGLQVNFVMDHGIQNLRQLQQTSSLKSLQVASTGSTANSSLTETSTPSNPRKGIKVRSPRRNESINGQSPVVSQIHTQSSNIISNSITPAALVVTKPVDTQHPLPIPNPPNLPQILSNVPQPQPQPQPQQSQQAIVLNGKFPNQINRPGPPPTNITPKPRPNDLIDLTDEEEKGKATSSVPVVTTTITDQPVNLAPKPQQPCFQRVIQAIPGNVALTGQPPSIRVVQPATQPTPTALVNNMNAPRLAYVMQSGVGPTRQLLIAPNSNPMRPVTSCRAPFSTLAYKTGISTIANGTVRVLTTPATSNIQLNKHPAALPDIRNYAVNPLWKLPPPAPSLKISKVAHGIVLSWNMNLSDKYADIVSYQLYAYQEIVGVPPSTSQWKKVGDVRALPLPMACTLTQFSEGNNYYFAVRAVDTHSRKGQYSTPGNISL